MTASLSDLQISSASKQFVRVPVSETTGADPTTDLVQFAFPPPGMEPATFYTGSWTVEGGIYYAQCLVGPTGTVALTPAFYDVYVKVTDNPETPVLLAGLLEVT